MLNPDSPIPLYRQLANYIEDQIRDGVYAIGDKIPSEPEFARRFNIGRPTVRQATEHLVRSKQLVRRRGAGTFVTDPTGDVSLLSMSGTLKAFRDKKIDIDVEMLGGVTLDPILQKDRHPFDNRGVFTIKRRISHHKEPLLVEEIYLLADIFKGFERFDLRGTSVSQLVSRHYYLTPCHAAQYFAVRAAQPPLDGLLGVAPETSLLRVRRYVDFDHIGTAVYAELFCRTDRFEFSQTIGG